LKKEYEEALRELEIARNQFENCDSLFFDLANDRLNMALKKVDYILKKVKVLKVMKEKAVLN
jgi:hypothetical protein